MAVNGRFLATRAVYPDTNLFPSPPPPCFKERKACREVEDAVAVVVAELWRSTCAFCLITSAGVRMRQDASSATPEAVAWITVSGRRPAALVVVDFRRDFVDS